MDKPKKISKIKLIKCIVLLLIFFALVAACYQIYIVGPAYYEHYRVDPTWLNTQADFGAYGDFIGGLINPVLSFFTIIILVVSVFLQEDELVKTREQLAISAMSHSQNLKLLEKEHKRKQLLDVLNSHWEKLEIEINKPYYDNISLYTLINMTSDYLPEKLNAYDEASLILSNKTDNKKGVILREVRSQFSSIVLLTIELYELLDNKTVAQSYYSRVAVLAEKLRNMCILTSAESSHCTSMQAPPEKLKFIEQPMIDTLFNDGVKTNSNIERGFPT